MLTIVITTFNRAELVLRSIRSALRFAAAFSDAEIIVVDDASTDQSGDLIRCELGPELRRGTVRYLRNPVNLGVTGSKNAGYVVARKKWVAFLDSDDILLAANAAGCRAAFENYPDAPLIFFRCIGEHGQRVGRVFTTDHFLDVRTYIRHASYGEAFTVVNKEKVQVEPYVAELRGYEGLGCARIIACHGPAVLSTAYVRQYDQRGSDRLSALRGMLWRYPLIAKGHRMMLDEFGDKMSGWHKLSLAVKSAAYGAIGRAYHALNDSSS